MKPTKLNYRHSLDSMSDQLERHDEVVFCDWRAYEVHKCLIGWGEKEELVLFRCFKKSELADYINKKNGFN